MLSRHQSEIVFLIVIFQYCSHFLKPENRFRYPIDKTSINFNLTKTNQSPRIGRFALLALVEWITNKNRSIGVETHGVGTDPTVTSFSFSHSVGTDSIEEIKSDNAGSDNS